MSSGTSRGNEGSGNWLLPSIGLIVALAIGIWFFWPSKVILDQRSYEIAIALYRVCDQEDVDGLEKLQTLLDEHAGTEGTSAAATAAIQEIIDLGRTSNWEQATQATRKIMDDQVQH